MTTEPMTAAREGAYSDTPETLACRRRLCDAIHAHHVDQRVIVDSALAAELDAAWDAYDASIVLASRTALVEALRETTNMCRAARIVCNDVANKAYLEELIQRAESLAALTPSPARKEPS